LTLKLSKTQVDRLGDRLKRGAPSEADLRSLDDYRRTFGEAYETVIRIMRDQLRLEPTGRPAKSTASIIEKLRRESIRLSQVQDVAGCRVVVADTVEQDRVVDSLRSVFPDASIIDRRLKPSHGYRAVHVVVESSGKLVEIQSRTSLQHQWAELSEKLADMIDPSIKYGGGQPIFRDLLMETSQLANDLELVEKEIAEVAALNEQEEDKRVRGILARTVEHKKRLVSIWDEVISELERKNKETS
jgi:ppGpp synthetase/RelA/SpoT-type nucleotidyltranferase